MPRLTPIPPAHATGKAKQLLDAVQAKLGVTPNLMRTLANSPAALEAYLNFDGALANGLLKPQTRSQIALAVAEMNSCSYCLSAHTALGKMCGLNEHEIARARQSSSHDPRNDAALKLARAIVVQRGEISDVDLLAARDGGLNDGEIAEVVANVALNILTNYFNHLAQTEVDFPKVVPGHDSTVCAVEAADAACALS